MRNGEVVSLYLPKELIERIDAAAASEGRKRSNWVTWHLEQLLKKTPRTRAVAVEPKPTPADDPKPAAVVRPFSEREYIDTRTPTVQASTTPMVSEFIKRRQAIKASNRS